MAPPFILIFYVAGLGVGSVLNLFIDRLTAKEPLLGATCPVCKPRSGAFDLVPLLSYLWLRNRCCEHHASRAIRLPLVELATAFILAGLFWRLGAGQELGISMAFAIILVLIFVISLENRMVVDKVVLPAIVLAFALSFFHPGFTALNAISGAALGLGGMALLFVLSVRRTGTHNIKLGALLGFMTGFPLVGAVLAVAAILLVYDRLAAASANARSALSIGPYLALTALLILIWR